MLTKTLRLKHIIYLLLYEALLFLFIVFFLYLKIINWASVSLWTRDSHRYWRSFNKCVIRLDWKVLMQILSQMIWWNWQYILRCWFYTTFILVLSSVMFDTACLYLCETSVKVRHDWKFLDWEIPMRQMNNHLLSVMCIHFTASQTSLSHLTSYIWLLNLSAQVFLLIFYQCSWGNWYSKPHLITMVEFNKSLHYELT